MSATYLLRNNPSPADEEIRRAHPRQPLPLHRLRQHRRGDPRRRARRGERRERAPSAARQPAASRPPSASARWSGTSVQRKEDRRHLLGKASFTDDGGQLYMGYAHFVRSPYAHARIVSIDARRAESLDGVYATLTGEEVKELTAAVLPDRPGARRADRRVLPRRRQGPLPGRRRRGGARRVARDRPRRRRARRGRIRAAPGRRRLDQRRRARRPAAARGGRLERRLARRLRLRRRRLGARRRPTTS